MLYVIKVFIPAIVVCEWTGLNITGRQSVFLQRHCLSVMLRRQDVSTPYARSSAGDILSKSSCTYPNKQPVQTKEIAHKFSPITAITRIHTHYDALSVMVLSRFPPLSTQAWERQNEETDIGARGSLELFWQVKVTEM